MPIFTAIPHTIMKEQEIKIVPLRSFSLNLTEIWENRELLYFFVWRDVKVKYRQTFLGILWAILQPLLLMAIFYVVFFRALKITSEISYPVYTLAALVFWGLFSSGISHSSESLLSSAPMIRKIYFPRLLIPLSTLIASLIDFFIAFLLFLIILLVFRQPVNWNAVWCFPIALLVTFFSSMGIGMFLAALNVKYRDFRYLLPFAMQLLFFGSQIVYSIHALDTYNQWIVSLFYLNPLNGALELIRYGLSASINWTGVLISLFSLLVCLATGFYYFRKTENSFADIL